jgi:hypothetical protein
MLTRYLDVFCVSAVDPSKLHTAEFVYLISEYAGGYLKCCADVYFSRIFASR